MGRRGIEVEVILFHVLAMIAFVARQPEQALLQDMIAPIPKCQREAHTLVPVADPADAVFSPAIGARPRHVMRKIFPRSPARTVILAYRSPLPLGKIRPPTFPVLGALVGFLQALFFGCHSEVPRSGPCEGEYSRQVRESTSIDRRSAERKGRTDARSKCGRPLQDL